MSRFVQKIFATNSRNRWKPNKYRSFLAPIFFGETTPTVLRQIVTTIYRPPFARQRHSDWPLQWSAAIQDRTRRRLLHFLSRPAEPTSDTCERWRSRQWDAPRGGHTSRLYNRNARAPASLCTVFSFTHTRSPVCIHVHFKVQWHQMITLKIVQCHGELTCIFNFWHSGTLALRAERQSARMSEI